MRQVSHDDLDTDLLLDDELQLDSEFVEQLDECEDEFEEDEPDVLDELLLPDELHDEDLDELFDEPLLRLDDDELDEDDELNDFCLLLFKYFCFKECCWAGIDCGWLDW